jgi:predicted ATPase
LIDIVRNNCDVLESDSAEEIDAKVRFGLEELGLAPDAGAPYLLHLLGVRERTERLAGLSTEALKAHTFETLRQMALNGAQRRTLVFHVEDAHWIDRTSEEFLESLAESLGVVRILLLATFRPGYRPEWLRRSYATQLALPRLTPSDSLHVVRSMPAVPRLSDDVARVIADKAEGNPFFLEGMARAVAERGDLAVPDTVQGVLMARIDRLPENAKRVLQTASVLGREFPLRLLRAVADGGGAVDQHVIDLKRADRARRCGRRHRRVRAERPALARRLQYRARTGISRARAPSRR